MTVTITHMITCRRCGKTIEAKSAYQLPDGWNVVGGVVYCQSCCDELFEAAMREQFPPEE